MGILIIAIVLSILGLILVFIYEYFDYMDDCIGLIGALLGTASGMIWLLIITCYFGGLICNERNIDRLTTEYNNLSIRLEIAKEENNVSVVLDDICEWNKNVEKFNLGVNSKMSSVLYNKKLIEYYKPIDISFLNDKTETLLDD